MYIELFILIISMFALIKGSDVFIDSIASLAKKFNVSEFIIGLTLVAIGTSIPELASSVSASFAGSPEIILGNVIGSNIANICLVIGIAAFFYNIKTTKEIVFKDGLIVLFITALFFVLLFDGSINFIEALFMFLLYIAYILFTFEFQEAPAHCKDFIVYFFGFKYLTTIHSKIMTSRKDSEQMKEMFREGVIKDVLFSIVGLIVLVVAAKYLIAQSLFFAELFGVPEFFIGLSIIALGTSVPELSVTLAAVKKGFGEIALGNIIGSNIANILLIVSVSKSIGPVVGTNLILSMASLLIVTTYFFLIMRTNYKISKINGIILLLFYIGILFLTYFY